MPYCKNHVNTYCIIIDQKSHVTESYFGKFVVLYWHVPTLIFEINFSFALGLILVKEPYFNEAGYDKQKETMEGNENSKKYNEMVLIKILQVKYELLPTW